MLLNGYAWISLSLHPNPPINGNIQFSRIWNMRNQLIKWIILQRSQIRILWSLNVPILWPLEVYADVNFRDPELIKMRASWSGHPIIKKIRQTLWWKDPSHLLFCLFFGNLHIISQKANKAEQKMYYIRSYVGFISLVFRDCSPKRFVFIIKLVYIQKNKEEEDDKITLE